MKVWDMTESLYWGRILSTKYWNLKDKVFEIFANNSNIIGWPCAVIWTWFFQNITLCKWSSHGNSVWTCIYIAFSFTNNGSEGYSQLLVHFPIWVSVKHHSKMYQLLKLFHSYNNIFSQRLLCADLTYRCPLVFKMKNNRHLYLASWSMKLSDWNIWKTCGSCTSTWQIEPTFGIVLLHTWEKEDQ